MTTTSTSGSSITRRQSRVPRSNPDERTASSARRRHGVGARHQLGLNAIGPASRCAGTSGCEPRPSQPKADLKVSMGCLLLAVPGVLRTGRRLGGRGLQSSLRRCTRRSPVADCSSWARASSSAPPAIIWTSSSRVITALGRPLVEPAAVEQQEPVAHRVGVVRVVGDEDHAQAAVARLAMYLSTTPACFTPSAGRLVEDQHGGAEVDRAGDRDRTAAHRRTACRPAGPGRAGRYPSGAARSW